MHLKHAGQKSDEPAHYEAIDEILSCWNKDLTLNGGYSDKNLPAQPVYAVMLARSAIADPLVFARLSTNKTTLAQARHIFQKNCELHPPKEKYLEYLKKYTPILF